MRYDINVVGLRDHLTILKVFKQIFSDNLFEKLQNPFFGPFLTTLIDSQQVYQKILLTIN